MSIPKDVKKEVPGEILTLVLNWDFAESSNIVRKIVIEEIWTLHQN